MAISGIPNKFEIFQNFYLEIYGKKISYDDALTLYENMDDKQKSEFEQYYKDETGYNIVVPSGYGLELEGYLNEDGEYIINYSDVQNVLNQIKYTLDAYAKENGLIMDPQWAQYSAEEIIQMENEGVCIPQDVLDIAHTIYESSGANINSAEETDENAEEPTEKEPFLALIPKAKKNIEECEQTNEKVDDLIQEILPEQEKKKKAFQENQKDIRSSLEEYEGMVREWKSLQDKINNGNALSDSESKRYEELSKQLNAKEDDNKGMKLNDTELSNKLTEINIIAALGEKLADETVEIGDTLTYYISKTNRKHTRQEVAGQIGFFRAIVAMIQGKSLANDSVKIGNDTKEYMEESQASAMDIGEVLDIKVGSAETIEGEGEEVEMQEGAAEGSDENAEDSTENKEEKTSFVVTDESVLRLIDEANAINEESKAMIKEQLKFILAGQKDTKIAQTVDKIVTKVIGEFEEREAVRQEEIANLEKENEKATKELEDITGMSAEEVDKKIIQGKKDKDEEEPEYDDETKEKIKQQKEIIVANNARIAEIQQETVQDKADTTSGLSKEINTIDTKIGEEAGNFEANQQLAQKEIPDYNERMQFINNCGGTLIMIGGGTVEFGNMLNQMGMALLSVPFAYGHAIALINLGIATIMKGFISIAIGTAAMVVSDDDSMVDEADASVKKAGEAIPGAIDSLSAVKDKMSVVTGEESEDVMQENAQGEETGEAQGEPTEAAAGAEGETTDSAAVTTGTTAAPTMTTASAPEEGTAVAVAADTPVGTDEAAEVVESTESAEPQDAEQEIEEAQDAGDETAEVSTTEAEKNPDDAVEDSQDATQEVGDLSGNDSTGETKKEDKEENMDTDKAQDTVDDVAADGQESANDSEKVLSDTEKDEKTLLKESKQLEKEMKKDQKEIEKLNKESEEEIKKQAEMLARYEELSTANEQMMAEDEAAGASAQAVGASMNGQQAAASGFSMQAGGGSNHEQELQANGMEIEMLANQFTISNSKVTKNQAKLKNLQKTNNKRYKQFEKKNKIRDKKIKEAEKKEQEKQKKLAKQLGIVGIQENIFNITLSTGTIMVEIIAPPLLSNPFTAAAGAAISSAGAILINVGTIGVAACGVTKAIINLANGNLAGALMGLASTALSVATSVTGAGAAMGPVMTGITQGLSIVSNTAQMVNNVRAVQGKEANGIMSKIATVAGVAQSITGAAGSLAGGIQSGMNGVMQIAGVVGTAMSSTSQLMSEFGGNEKIANILGTVGGAMSLASSAYSLMSGPKGSDAEGNDGENNGDENNDGNKTEGKDKTETEKQSSKEAKKAEKAEAKKNKEAEKAEAKKNKETQNAKKDETKNDNSNIPDNVVNTDANSPAVKEAASIAKTSENKIVELSDKTGMSPAEVAQAQQELQNAANNQTNNNQPAVSETTSEDIIKAPEASTGDNPQNNQNNEQQNITEKNEKAPIGDSEKVDQQPTDTTDNKTDDELKNTKPDSSKTEKSKAQIKSERRQKLNKILETTGEAMNVVSGVMGIMNQSNTEQSKKKTRPETSLSAKAKRIIELDTEARNRLYRKYYA